MCQPKTDHPNRPGPSTVNPAAASAQTSEMIAQAAQLARLPAPTANLLFPSLEWYAARPNTRPTPLIVRLWIGQTAKLIEQYQDLLAVLVEMQVETIDHRSQANQPTQEETQ